LLTNDSIDSICAFNLFICGASDVLPSSKLSVNSFSLAFKKFNELGEPCVVL